ncbi:MAG: NADP oxidoreductase [Thermodesulfobacteriota bacterium]
MNKIRMATAWLDGCSGCHMSFLDLDERLLDVTDRIELVFSPLVDAKEFPEAVDVTLVEGAISSDKDEELIRLIRSRTKTLISFGDCAVTANVPAMRNKFRVDEVLARGYLENSTGRAEAPQLEIPHLLKQARPVHEFVDVDVFLPGCPPAADVIFFAIGELLEGRVPDPAGKTRFGA